MVRRVHHLNCTTLRPPCARFMNGTGGIFSRGRLVCHCLLIEIEDGPILVDTGLGLSYIADPIKQLGRGTVFMLSTPLDPAETAVRQVSQLGFNQEDVRHIVMTHLDLDHSGGLPDFPNAQVHVLAPEYETALHPPTSQEKGRYIPTHWAHGPKWVVHPLKGEKWFGFDHVQEILPDVFLVPMIGHTRGHCGVAVRMKEGWLFHCGDAYTDRSQIEIGSKRVPLGARMHRRTTTVDPKANERWPAQLGSLVRDREKGVSLCCSHDPVEFSRFQSKH